MTSRNILTRSIILMIISGIISCCPKKDDKYHFTFYVKHLTDQNSRFEQVVNQVQLLADSLECGIKFCNKPKVKEFPSSITSPNQFFGFDPGCGQSNHLRVLIDWRESGVDRAHYDPGKDIIVLSVKSQYDPSILLHEATHQIVSLSDYYKGYDLFVDNCKLSQDIWCMNLMASHHWPFSWMITKSQHDKFLDPALIITDCETDYVYPKGISRSPVVNELSCCNVDIDSHFDEIITYYEISEFSPFEREIWINLVDRLRGLSLCLRNIDHSDTTMLTNSIIQLDNTYSPIIWSDTLPAISSRQSIDLKANPKLAADFVYLISKAEMLYDKKLKEAFKQEANYINPNDTKAANELFNIRYNNFKNEIEKLIFLYKKERKINSVEDLRLKLIKGPDPNDGTSIK